MNKCLLCDRELGEIRIESHHLIPKTFGGKETVLIHKICHQKIHATFTERELLHHYHTFDRLCEHSEIIKFVKWVNKKPIDYYTKNDETSIRKNKRK